MNLQGGRSTPQQRIRPDKPGIKMCFEHRSYKCDCPRDAPILSSELSPDGTHPPLEASD